MDWLGQLNKALGYIEDNLDGDIELDRVAQLACCSGYHFQRMFSYMAGVPLSEYVRRRRMTRAAFDLQNTDVKIIDVALRYGYDSPTAFNRAFQSVHGAPPSAARQEGVVLKAYYPISFKITIRGEAEMNYRIETKPAFRIVGAKLTLPNSVDSELAFAQVPKFWQEAGPAVIPTLIPRMDGEPKGILGVSVGDWQNTNSDFDYYIAAASSQPAPEGTQEYVVPSLTWAIFECVGAMPHSIQNMQRRIMTEWFPNSGYNYADGPDIEQYTEGDQSSEEYVTYIWVPVQKA